MRIVWSSRLCECLFLLAVVVVVVSGRPSFEGQSVDDQSSTNNGESSISNDITTTTTDNSGTDDGGDGSSNNNAAATAAVAGDTQVPATSENAADPGAVAQSSDASSSSATGTEPSGTSKNQEDGEPNDGTVESLADYVADLWKGKPQPSEIATKDPPMKEESPPIAAANTTGSESTPAAAQSNSDPSVDASVPQSTAGNESTSAQNAASTDTNVPQSTSAQTTDSAGATETGSITGQTGSITGQTTDATVTESASAQNTMTTTDQTGAVASDTTSTVTGDTVTATTDDYYDWENTWLYDGDDIEDSPDYEDFKKLLTDPCSAQVNLDNYCIVDDNVRSWFQNEDLTIQGLGQSLFDMNLVDQLASRCERGVWCLYDDLNYRDVRRHLNVLEVMCLESMMECLLEAVVMRQGCTDKDTAEFNFITDAAILVCNMTNSTVPWQYDPCLLDEMRALHLMYADFKATNRTFPQPEMDVSCGGPARSITDQFLCQGECQDVAAKEILRPFISEKYNQPGCSSVCPDDDAQVTGTWTTDPLTSATDTYSTYDGYDDDNDDDDDDEDDDGDNDNSDVFDFYNGDDDDEDEDDDSGSFVDDDWSDFTTVTTTSADVDDTTTYYYAYNPYNPYPTKESFYPDSNIHQNLDGEYEHDSQEGQDESLMLALFAATAIGIMFMVLGLVYWRKNRRRHLYYSHGDGYNRVPDDVGPLLPKSFN